MKTTKELQRAVSEYQNGKKESFNIIYEQSYKYLHTCVIHVVKNEDVAMDMLQETYLEISRSICQLKDIESFMSWAAMIANRKCFAYLRKQRDVLITVEEDDENSGFFEMIADNEAFIPETVFQDREKVRLIKEIIDNLSDIQRLCIIGFYYNEQKQDEIAMELGIPVNTVKSHLNRAKAKIKEAVVELDTKKGTRLYSLAPFMLLFLDLEAEACETAVMSPVLSQLCGNGKMLNAATGMKKMSGATFKTKKTWKMVSGADKVLKIAGVSMKVKVVAGIVVGLLGAVSIGSIIIGVYNVAELIETVAEAESEEKQAGDWEVSLISEEYRSYGKGNQGRIPVCNKEGKYGLITYDNEVIVPFEYDSSCPMVNEEGQSFFRNDTGSYVFDKNGKQLFHTKRSIQSVNEGIIFAMDGSYFEGDFAYYNVNGETLYEYDVTKGEEVGAVGCSEGYAFFLDEETKRLNKNENIENMTDIKYGNQSMLEDEGGSYSMSEGINTVYHVPVSPLNKGFYLSRDMEVILESYGVYALRNAEDSVSYCFDFSSLFNYNGLSFSRTEAEWGLNNFFENGCLYNNYGSLICPYIIIDGQKISYLIDTSKLAENKEGYKASGEYLSDEDIWDYDRTLLTKEALLFEADNIYISNEKYWLVKKDGQWGYIDHVGNVMGMYDDATEFYHGKAMVIEDGIAYVIDESFAKIQKVGKATSVTNHGELFKVLMEEEGTKILLIY